MKGETRCVDGRLMRHDPFPDDPDLETDIGKCPECDGDGRGLECGDMSEEKLRKLLDPHGVIVIKEALRQSLEDFSNSQTPVGLLCVSPSDLTKLLNDHDALTECVIYLSAPQSPIERLEQGTKEGTGKMAQDSNMSYWLDIETAPLNEDVILGWWEVGYIDVDLPKVWRMKIGWAGAANTKPAGMSNAWRDGSATHWRKCPTPPTPTAAAIRAVSPVAAQPAGQEGMREALVFKVARALDVHMLKRHESPVLETALEMLAADPDFPPSEESMASARCAIDAALAHDGARGREG